MKLPLQIRFTDIDIYAHVNNAIYAEWFDTGRFALLTSLIPDMDPKGKSVVMVHLETNFRRQVLRNDEIFLDTRITKVGNRSIGMTQYIVNARTGDIHADSYGVLSTYDAARQGSFDMPDPWRKKFEQVLDSGAE